MLRLVFSPVELEVWDWDKTTDDDLIGGCRFTFRYLLDAMAAGREAVLDLINPKKVKKSSYKNSGQFRITGVRGDHNVRRAAPYRPQIEEYLGIEAAN